MLSPHEAPVPNEAEPAIFFQPHWLMELRSAIVEDVCKMQSVEFRNVERMLQDLLDRLSNERGNGILLQEPALKSDERESLKDDCPFKATASFKATTSRGDERSLISHNQILLSPASVASEAEPVMPSNETISPEVTFRISQTKEATLTSCRESEEATLRSSRETAAATSTGSFGLREPPLRSSEPGIKQCRGASRTAEGDEDHHQSYLDKHKEEWKSTVHAFLGMHARHAESTKRVSARHKTMRYLGIDQRHKKNPNTALSRWVAGSYFSSAVVILVLGNVFWIGYESELNMFDAINDRFGTDIYANVEKGVYPPNTTARHVSPERSTVFKSISLTFAGLFALELIIKMVALRGSFFFGQGWGMNLLDFVMVLSTTLEVTVGTNLRQARLLRAFRMARVLRIIRMIGAFRQLRQIVCSIYSSVTVLGWSLVMMCLIMYLFSLVIMQIVAPYLEDAAINNRDAHFLAEHFGSTTTSLQTLFRSITGGFDWENVAIALGRVSFILPHLFSMYIFIMVFGVMNVLVGVFCEAASECSALDQDLMVHRERINMNHVLETLSYMFSQIDIDDDGVITWEEFREYARKEECFNYFMAKGLNLMDANSLFQVLDESYEDEAGKVDQNNFLIVMMRMIGQAKSTDLMMLLHESRRHMKKMRKTLKEHREILSNLQANQQSFMSSHHHAEITSSALRCSSAHAVEL